MTKNVLLAATAVSVMAFAGAASAHDLTFRAAAAPATDIDAGEVVGTDPAYPLAQEAKTPTSPNTFALVDELSSGFFPSGNVLLTITLVGNAEFDSTLTAANVTKGGSLACSTFTAVPSNIGDTTATFIISNSAADCDAFNLDLPIVVTGAGAVSVRTTLVTDGPATPIDGGSATKLIVSRPDAFVWTVDATIGGSTALGGNDGAYADTVATLDGSPAYTEFKVATGFHDNVDETDVVGILGTAALVVDEDAKYDLILTADVLAAHVTDFDAVVTGSFSALDADFGGVSDTDNGTTATFNNIQGAMALPKAGLPGNLTADNAFVVTYDSGAIPTSTYSIAVTYTLDTNFYNPDTISNPKALEKIERDGTNIVFPWMNSSTVQSASGTTNMIRLANVSGAATGAVFGQVLNSVGADSGYVAHTAPVEIFPNIAAGGERLINTTTLTSKLGDFGRGDVQISIEARPEQVTARRYATLANGSVTEFESGTVAGDQAAGIAGTTPNYIP